MHNRPGREGPAPRYPGVTSALGCVMADMRHDAVQTLNQDLAAIDFDQLGALKATFEARCRNRLEAAGVAFESVREELVLDMLYQGQTHTVAVSVPANALNADANVKLVVHN